MDASPANETPEWQLGGGTARRHTDSVRPPHDNYRQEPDVVLPVSLQPQDLAQPIIEGLGKQ